MQENLSGAKYDETADAVFLHSKNLFLLVGVFQILFLITCMVNYTILIPLHTFLGW